MIVDGLETDCLLDSGSQVSTISESFYNKHLSTHRSLETLEQLITIEGIGGHLLSYKGYTTVSISFPGSPNGETAECLCLVCPDTAFSSTVPVLLGTNVLCNLWPDSVPLWASAEVRHIYATVANTNKFCDAESGRLGSLRVLNHRSVVLKPGETTSVPAISKVSSTRLPYPAVVQEPTCGRRFTRDVLVRNTLVTMPTHGRSRVNVQMTNLSDRDVTLAPKSVVADLFLPNWTKPVGRGEKQNVEFPILSAKAQQNPRTVHNTAPSEDSVFLDKFTIDESLPDSWKLRVRKLISEYRDVFSMHDMDIGCTEMVEHRIDLVSDVPFRERSRPIRSSDVEDARRHIQQLLDAQIIRESHSCYASPIVLVRKKSGDIRLTVDYRKLNKLTVRDAHSLPRVEEAFTRLVGSKYFSTMDLKSGYYNVKMREEDKHKTAFTCPLGFFEWNRMPQGVTNAPATFQRLMERCLGNMNLDWAIAFLDDLIIFSNTLEDHEQRLRQALQRLRSFGLKLSPEKCHFFQRSVKYLGHVVSELGIHTDQSKVEAVHGWPSPNNMKELRSFLGFLGYYRRFIKDFAKICQPLNDLLKGYTHSRNKGSKRLFVDNTRIKQPFGALWTTDCQESFLKLKAAITSAPVLAIADPKLPYELHTDASRSGLGGALYQRHDGVLRPVAFASRSLSATERNYPAHKLEFLALKWAITEKFSDYLYGCKFTVLTDNNPLTYIMTTARLDATGQRWVAALSSYDFKIQYIAGKKNIDADGLSRRPHEENSGSDDEWDQERVTRELIDRVSTSGILDSVLSVVEEPQPAVVGLAMSTSVVSDLNYDPTGIPIVSLRKEELIDAQTSDSVVCRAREVILSGTFKSSRKELPAVRSLLRNHKSYVVIEGLLYKLSKFNGKTFKRLVVPSSLKSRVLIGIHDDIGHLGSDRAAAIARTRFYWLNMEDDITSYCKQCKNCILRKGNNKHPAPLYKLHSTSPMDLVCIDFLSVDQDSSGKENVLVVTDHFTRYSRAFVTRKQTAKDVADMLWTGFFLDFGLPRRLHSDRGACFTGKLLSHLKEITGVQSSFTTPYHPQGNGQCERFNRTLLDMLGTLDEHKKNKWSKHVKYLVHAYNCTTNDSTGYSPFELMFGRQPRLPIDWYFGLDSGDQDKSYNQYVRELKEGLQQAYEVANSVSDKSHLRNKTRINKRVRRADLCVGDRVLVRNVSVRGRQKLANVWCPDVHLVCERKGGDDSPVYVVRREDGKGVKRTLHRNLLLPCGFLPLPRDESVASSQSNRRKEKPVVDNNIFEGEDQLSAGEGEPDIGHSETDSDEDIPVSGETPENLSRQVVNVVDTDSSESEEEVEILRPQPAPRRPVPNPRRSTRERKPPERLRYNQLGTPTVEQNSALSQLLNAAATLIDQNLTCHNSRLRLE